MRKHVGLLWCLFLYFPNFWAYDLMLDFKNWNWSVAKSSWMSISEVVKKLSQYSFKLLWYQSSSIRIQYMPGLKSSFGLIQKSSCEFALNPQTYSSPLSILEMIKWTLDTLYLNERGSSHLLICTTIKWIWDSLYTWSQIIFAFSFVCDKLRYLNFILGL